MAVQRLQVWQVYGSVSGVVTQLSYGTGSPIWITEQQLGQIW